MTPTVTPTDAELVKQVLAGDQKQYQILVERYYRVVYNTAYRLLGTTTEAADMTQETFLRAYNALHAFRQDAALTPWLCRIATNLSLNQLKRRRPSISLDDDEGESTLVLHTALRDVSMEPQSQLLAAEQQQQLRQAILALPPEQRMVIELRHFQEQSYEEIAQALDISLSNVKVRLFRARKQLRQLLEKEL
ncbi:MAG: sigma-70 family RNA polymerase sigma factor [Chloroflexota bacterium]